ncbi:MAG: sigma-70 family RNA polymerase sigma factor [Thermoleophilaceae bacterium]|nr:sigma-70 family RNA polymerase sigma factor [Thermoleophilaceae bacterium]
MRVLTREAMREGARKGGRAAGRAPTRAEIEPAVLELIRRYGGEILRTAYRYSLCPDDAEDAYQRGLEILLTKAPSTREADLLPWLKTVVKHEAFAIRRQRGRAQLTDDGEPPASPLEPSAGHATEEHAERYERLRLGAEALSRLKPQEVRALLLKAQGLSYKEICEETSWTYTKVNRCLTEGRRAFLERVAAIESGAECERLAPLLSRLADGEATADDMAALRPHLRGCLACRAALRDFRAAPARVAAAVPLGALAAADQAHAAEPAARGAGSVVHWLHERAVLAWVRAHELAQQGLDLLTGSKVAAVAASTAALAGGGAVAVEQLHAPAGPTARVAATAKRGGATRPAWVRRDAGAAAPSARGERRRAHAHPRGGPAAAAPAAVRTVAQPQPAPAPAAVAAERAPASGEFGP